MESNVFEIRSVRITYGLRTAVDNLTLEMKAGKSLGLLGVNGAGKTSTIKALLGMLKPRSGSLNIFGLKPGDPKAFRKIGFAPEDGVPPDFLTAEEYLSFIGSFRIPDRATRRQKVKEMSTWFDLQPRKKVRDYSKGMKKRLVLGAAFLGDPAFLILDEPLNGLDPLLIIKLREKLDLYLKNGGSILYSSHILAEVEKTCDDIAILSQGKLVCRETTLTLVKEFESVEKAFAVKVEGATVASTP